MGFREGLQKWQANNLQSKLEIIRKLRKLPSVYSIRSLFWWNISSIDILIKINNPV